MKKFVVLFTLIFTVAAFGGDKIVKLNIEGMRCGGCVAKVESALKSIKGVKNASVSLEEQSATVTLTANSKATTDILVDAVADAGFSASDKTGKVKQQATKKHDDSDCEDKAACCTDGKACSDKEKETK